jgi:hypothetical protein
MDALREPRSHHRWVLTGAALAALVLAAAGLRLESTRIVGSPFLSPPDSAGLRWGPAVVVNAGERHRCRLTVERAAPGRGAAAAEAAWFGIVPEGRPWHPDALALRRLDLGRSGSRVYQFAFRPREPQRRRVVWKDMASGSGLRLARVELASERAVWDARALAWPKGGRLRDFLARLALALGVCAAAGAGAVAWTRARERPDAPPARGGAGAATATGLAAYLLAGCALWSLDAAVSWAPDTQGMDPLWSLLPGRGGWRWEAPLGLSALGVAVLPLAGAALGAAVWSALVRRRAWLAWTLPVALLGARFAVSTLGARCDFKVYDTAGLALWAGTNPYALTPERVLNPPPFVLACGLLPWLPLGVAAFAWFGLKAAAAAWCVPLARRGLAPPAAAAGRPLPWWLWPEWLALWIAGRLIAMDLQYGNTNTLVLVSLLAVAAAWAAQRPGTAGGFAAAGIALKATPVWAPLAALLAGRGRWALLTLAAAAALTLASAAALERIAPGAGLGFAREAAPRPGDLSLGRADNQSLRGLMDRHVGGAEVHSGTLRAVPTLALGATVARACEATLALLVLAAVWLLARRARDAGAAAGPGRDAWADLWAGATLALLLTSPGSWTVHFALLYLPLVVFVTRAQRGDRVSALAAGLLATAIVPPALSRGLGNLALSHSWLTWATLAGLVALLRPVRLAARPGRAGVP